MKETTIEELRPGDVCLTRNQIVQVTKGFNVMIIDCDNHRDGCCQGSYANLWQGDLPIRILERETLK